jgi:putative phosphoesterase
MKVALVGDIHANLPALEAVLDDAGRQGARSVWNLGDFVGYGPMPDEVVRRMRDVAAVSIIGNYDLNVLAFPAKDDKWQTKKTPQKYLAFRWAWENLSAESREYLRSLDRQARLEVCGFRVLLTHGSPADDEEHLRPSTAAQRLGELARMTDADVVLCGHSHEAMDRDAGGVRFINPGSVGRPEGSDPRAAYAVLDFQAGALDVRLCRVEYDVDRTVAALRDRKLPEEFVQVFVQGRNLDEVLRGGDAGSDAAALLAAADDLAVRCDDEREHSRQVTHLALRLFDELADVHDLGPQARLWLECGAMLHDIGWCDGQRGHHRASLRLIMAADDLPLTARQRGIVASIARYHRKALPREDHGHFSALDAADQHLVSVAGGLVRIADGLDRSHSNAVRNVTCRGDRKRIVIRCQTDGSADAEQWAATKKADLLQRALGRKVIIETGPDE